MFNIVMSLLLFFIFWFVFKTVLDTFHELSAHIVDSDLEIEELKLKLIRLETKIDYPGINNFPKE